MVFSEGGQDGSQWGNIAVGQPCNGGVPQRSLVTWCARVWSHSGESLVEQMTDVKKLVVIDLASVTSRYATPAMSQRLRES